MNYKLAKKLTDLGFPGSENCPIELGCCVPTLEELIDELGDEFENLKKCQIKKCKQYPHFTAIGWKKKFHIVQGKTHIEAVAKLYIALRK